MSTPRPGRPVLGRLLAAYACSSVATGLPWPLLLVLVWDQYGDGPHGALVVGLAGAARMAPYVLLSWAVGSLGDHVRAGPAGAGDLGAAAGLPGRRGGRASPATTSGSACWPRPLAVPCGTPTYPAIAAALPGLAGAAPGAGHRAAGDHRGLGLGRRPGAGRAAARRVAAAVDPRGRRGAGRARAGLLRRDHHPGPGGEGARRGGRDAARGAALPPGARRAGRGRAAEPGRHRHRRGAAAAERRRRGGAATPGSGWRRPASGSARSALRCWPGWLDVRGRPHPRPADVGGAVALVAATAGAVAGAARCSRWPAPAAWWSRAC